MVLGRFVFGSGTDGGWMPGRLVSGECRVACYTSVGRPVRRVLGGRYGRVRTIREINYSYYEKYYFGGIDMWQALTIFAIIGFMGVMMNRG